MKRRDLTDNTLRLGLFYPNAPSIHVTSRVVADPTNPDAMSLATHRRIAAVGEEIGLNYLFIADRRPPVYGNWIVSKQPETQHASFDYTRKLALLAEDSGVATVLLAEHPSNPFGPAADQLYAWTVAAGLATITKHIELRPAVRPAFKHPVIVAKMAGRIDQMSGGQAALNLGCGHVGSTGGPLPGSSAHRKTLPGGCKNLWTSG